MLDQEPVTGHNTRLLRGLIWAGVLLAPLAAAVVLLGGSSNSVRFAVVLIAVSMVLIGASVLIRTDPVLQRMDVEDRVAEEIASLRRELRAEFGRSPDRGAVAPVRGGPGPVRGAVAPVRGGAAPEEAGFFGAGPATGDPFAVPMTAGAHYPAPRTADDQYPGPMTADDQYPGPMMAEEPFAVPIGPARPEPAFGAGGRASVPVVAAAAAVRPVPGPGPGGGPGKAPRGPQPGMAPPRRQTGPGLGRREPGTVAPGAPTAGAPIPRQRGAALTPPPQGVPRAAAAARPGAFQYSRAEALDADFGASDGYSGVNPEPTARVAANTYGTPAGDGYDQPDGVYGPAAGEEGYEQFNQGSGDYQEAHADSGYGEPGYAESEPGYTDNGDGDYLDDPDGYEVGTDQPPTSHQAADPQYRARRHRPSANDTNIGTLADFASFDGYGEPQPDERYVDPPGPGGPGRRR